MMLHSFISLLLVACIYLITIHAQAPGYLTYAQFKGKPYTVTTDARSFLINGERTMFLSGSIHYPRSTPQMWPEIFKQARADGLNLIEVYTFWNVHERVHGIVDWSGSANLTKFLQDAADAGLWVNLRVGPYACAEFRYGGIPTWVGNIPGMTFREYNPLWLTVTRTWLHTLIAKVRPFFADHGGPIVMAQIENELHTGGGDHGQQYIDWCGTVATELSVNVPWLMCNGDAAANTINTCNANDCTDFITHHGQNGRILIDQPAMWTENEGWFQVWGQPYPDRYPINNGQGWWASREPDELAYAIMRWFARGGSHMNYYMYHGGNHYSLWAASGLTTWYANDVNLNSDGLPNEPKYSHLHRMHEIIITSSEMLLNTPAQLDHRIPLLWYNPQTQKYEPGTQQYAWGFNTKHGIVYWLENEATMNIKVQFPNNPNLTYTLSPSSIFIPSLQYDTSIIKPAPQRRITRVLDMSLNWSMWVEPIPLPPTTGVMLRDTYPYEQLSTTLDSTSYLYYEHTFYMTSTLNGNLTWTGSASTAYMVFWIGSITGMAYYTITDYTHTQNIVTMSIRIPNNTTQYVTLTILSSSLGIDNGMGSGTTAQQQGIIKGQISYGGHILSNDGSDWLMRPYLTGEIFRVMSGGAVPWTPRQGKSPSSRTGNDAATWFRTTFMTPTIPVGAVLLYQPQGMWRGEAYLNGHSLGHYYMITSGDGIVCQSQYQIPLDYLLPINEFILHEEEGQITNVDGSITSGVDVSQISFLISYMETNTQVQIDPEISSW